MNKDQVSGKIDQATGKVKEKAGEAIGNQSMANRGVVDQMKGAAKETWGNAKDAAQLDAAERRRESEAHANRTRASLTETVQEAKNKLNEKIDEHKQHVHDRRSA